MIFKGKSGASYKIIEPAIGKGGEGSIYKIDGMPNFVLKVFSDSKRTEEIERKLLAMLEISLFNNTIDVVSYHITKRNGNQNLIYRCKVGIPEYLAPEIHEKMKKYKRLDTAPLPTFTRQTDLFALAIHIFALLMNGHHPFTCAVDLSKNCVSLSVPQPIENIRNGFFPFYMNRRGFTIPKYAPDFNQLPEKIRKLFIRAFVDGHKNPQVRPNAIEWYNALHEMRLSIVKLP